MEYGARGREGLHLLHSCKLVNGFAGLRRAFSAVSLASYLVELSEKIFPPGVPERAGFELLLRALQALDAGCDQEWLRIVFEGRVMALGGYAMTLERCCKCGRKYAGEGRAIFLRAHGGVACLRCSEDTTLTPRLDPDAVSAIRAIQSREWEALKDLRPGVRAVEQIKAALRLHIAFRVGERLRTAEYLNKQGE
jgi:DNA repair protein RecO (recombination protein O)